MAGDLGFVTAPTDTHAQPNPNEKQIPPGDLDVVLRGDTNSVRVERMVSSVPGLKLTTSGS